MALTHRGRHSDVALATASSCNFEDEGYGGALGLTLGLAPETGRLLFLATFGLVVWTHGRAIVRAVSILLLSAFVTLWAVSRRVGRTLLYGNRRRLAYNSTAAARPVAGMTARAGSMKARDALAAALSAAALQALRDAGAADYIEGVLDDEDSTDDDITATLAPFLRRTGGARSAEEADALCAAVVRALRGGRGGGGASSVQPAERWLRPKLQHLAGLAPRPP